MQFDFGQNWADFSTNAIDPERVVQARREFAELMQGIDLNNRCFLDIGFGQGFSLLAAAVAGAVVFGCDINPKCGEVLARNRIWFPELPNHRIPTVIGSILNDAVVSELRALSGGEGFDIVHSWGVLHHTGDMRRAIANAASLVRPGGHFVIAIYNRHWSSLPWFCVKRLYCYSPGWGRRLMIGVLYPVIWLAKLLVTGENPKKMERGMDFYYNVVDWVGGYPYEYASMAQTQTLVESLGFECVCVIPARVPTGCNEFIFRKMLV